MDVATLIGLTAGVLLVGWGVLSNGNLLMFADLPSLLIVVGGSVASTLIANPLKDALGLVKVVRNGFFAKLPDPREVIADLVSYAEVARRDGVLALEVHTRGMDDEFLIRGIQMAVDGNDPELIREVLTNELEAVAERHNGGKAMLEGLAKYAPAFGLIGTLIGLVSMLRHMDDASKIGPGMAVALLTTLYGALIANLIAIPLADKLHVRSQQELLNKRIILAGVMSIQSGDNPRIVEQRLKTFLPASMWVGPDNAAPEAVWGRLKYEG
jgi:chemotaxis protein MotA